MGMVVDKLNIKQGVIVYKWQNMAVVKEHQMIIESVFKHVSECHWEFLFIYYYQIVSLL